MSHNPRTAMHERHELSAAFPDMTAGDFAALCDDIAAHGVRLPVVLLDDKVLDGWHRYRAALEVGADVEFEAYVGADPAAYVLGLNLHRRHLTASQRAAAVVACSEWKPVGKPTVSANSAPGAELGASAKELAARADVSSRTIEAAKAAQRAGLGEAVRDGKMSAKAAAEQAKGEQPKRRRMNIVDADEAPPEVEPVDEEAVAVTRDILADYERLSRIVESDDKAAEAWAECQTLTRRLEELDALYKAKCDELAVMTREAKRWMRKAEALEKGGARAR